MQLMYFDYMQYMFRDLENIDFYLRSQTFCIILARNGSFFEKKVTRLQYLYKQFYDLPHQLDPIYC